MDPHLEPWFSNSICINTTHKNIHTYTCYWKVKLALLSVAFQTNLNFIRGNSSSIQLPFQDWICHVLVPFTFCEIWMLNQVSHLNGIMNWFKSLIMNWFKYLLHTCIFIIISWTQLPYNIHCLIVMVFFLLNLLDC